MTLSSTSSLRIELLSKDNYDTWCMQIEALLTKNDLWEYVDGTNVCPRMGAETRDAWVKNDKKAKADLIMAIQPSELKQTRGCETSREIWLKLQSIYASKGPARRATLLKQLIHQKMEDGDDVREHVAKFFDVVNKLEDMEIRINEDLVTIMLLYSLPQSYENFRCAIESRDELPTSEILKIKIIEESEARKKTSENMVVAMSVENRGRTRSNFGRNEGHKSNSIRVFKCYKCGTSGAEHKASVCPELKCYKCSTPGYKANTCDVRRSDDSNSLSEAVNSVDVSYCVLSHNVTTETDINSATISNRAWLLDSGCTTHLCGDKERFKLIEKSDKVKLNLASEAFAEVKGKGVVHVSVASDKGPRLIEFKDTLYVPNLRMNLISIAKITSKGHEVIFRKNNACTRDEHGNISVIADRKGELYYVRETSECAMVKSDYSETVKWHERLGHLNIKDLIKLTQEGVLPMTDIRNKDQTVCEVCLKGKMTVLPFKQSHSPCEETLRLVYSDVVGPFRTESTGHARYFVTFIDDRTRWCEVYFLKNKNGVLDAFKLYQKLVEKQTGKRIKYLQSDNGGEYCNIDFDNYLADQGIRRRLTIPHTPQQNGIAERMNRTLLNVAR